ncbi:MAG TPA: hypothetical protein VM690_02465, partial [Gaiellaceae bacterium]|nr:hypothetical protein [Gaiellaceae bacterium]
AIPVTLLGLFTMRRNTARPLITAVATLPAVAFLLAAGAAFRPTGAQVNGLAATVHHHHLLVGAALAVVIALPATTLWLPKR